MRDTIKNILMLTLLGFSSQFLFAGFSGPSQINTSATTEAAPKASLNKDAKAKEDCKETEEKVVASRKDIRFYTGLEFNNRQDEGEQDENNGGIFDNEDTFFVLQFVNGDVDSDLIRSRGQVASSFSLFYDKKAKAPAKEGDEDSGEEKKAEASSGEESNLDKISNELADAQTAGVSMEFNYWFRNTSGDVNDFVNIAFRTEQYVEVDIPDEIVSDYYLGLSFAPRFEAGKEPITKLFSWFIGAAHLENLDRENRFFTRLQWDYKRSVQDYSGIGVSAEYSTPFGSSTEGEDTFQVRVFASISPKTIAGFLNPEKK